MGCSYLRQMDTPCVYSCPKCVARNSVIFLVYLRSAVHKSMLDFTLNANVRFLRCGD